MSARTRYLLDKVIVRYTLDGMLSLSLGRDPTNPQAAAIRLFQSATTQPLDLFVAPASAHILDRLRTTPRVAPLIHLFVQRTQIAIPTRYFTRWSRRVREFGFSPEDARMLALSSFSTNGARSILGMHSFITYDHPMVNLWDGKHAEIERRFNAMRRQLAAPYNQIVLPSVQLLS